MQNIPFTYANINIENLKHNLAIVKEIVTNRVKVMSVVKADAYGHGAVTVAKALSEAGTDCFGVATVDEALELREKAGIESDIYILSRFDRYSVPEIIEHGFIPVIYDLDGFKRLSEEAARKGIKVRAHLKFDTSMGRLGFFTHEAFSLLDKVAEQKSVVIEGFMSHLSSADEEDKSYSKNQLSKFDNIIAIAKERGQYPKVKHIANSAGVINLKYSYYDMVRPGIMLYGSAPARALEGRADLRPVMSIQSRIISVKEFTKGKSISYSRTFTTERNSRIAVLPIGYGDGYPRLLSNRGHVMINGKKASVVGNVTMDLMMVDVTDIKDAFTGSIATILGDGVSAWDLAEAAETISYEIFTGVSKRVERVVVEG